MRISDWSSDVCSSDLRQVGDPLAVRLPRTAVAGRRPARLRQDAVPGAGGPRGELAGDPRRTGPRAGTARGAAAVPDGFARSEADCPVRTLDDIPPPRLPIQGPYALNRVHRVGERGDRSRVWKKCV